MWALAQRAGLDLNSPYAYVLWGDLHARTSVVATVDGELVGFITGFLVPREPSTAFVWQIAVDDRFRGRGIGSRMLDALVERTGVTAIEATVTPDNAASAALFRGLGARHGTPVEETPAYGEDLFPAGHAPEIRFRIPVAPQRTAHETARS